MKKIVLAVIAAGMMITNASAFLYINWSAYPGIVTPSNDPLFPDLTTPALFQLIFTPDAIVGDALPGGAVDGNDVVLQEQVITAGDLGGDFWATTSSWIYGPETYQVGYVYVRVFEAGTGIGNVPVGALYFTGILYSTVDNPAGPVPPEFVDLGPGGTGPYGEYALNQTVVPEPSVIALAALGTAVVAVRRFRRLRSS